MLNIDMERLIYNLREMLASAFTLYLTTHGAHWNIEGRDFYQLHGMLKDQYEEIWASIDDIAERIRALDDYAPATMGEYMRLSRLSEGLPAPLDPKITLTYLVNQHEAFIDLMMETMGEATDADQQGIINFLGGRIEIHQKHRWMLLASSKG